MLLSDLVKADLMPDEVKECRYSCSLNVNKYRVLYKVYSLIWNCQHTSPIFSTDTELSNILRVRKYVFVWCTSVCHSRIIVFVFHMPYMVFHFYSVQAAVMQMQMSEAELSELSHTREPPSKKGSDKHNSRVIKQCIVC